jgi:hypothetical protein
MPQNYDDLAQGRYWALNCASAQGYDFWYIPDLPKQASTRSLNQLQRTPKNPGY